MISPAQKKQDKYVAACKRPRSGVWVGVLEVLEGPAGRARGYALANGAVGPSLRRRKHRVISSVSPKGAVAVLSQVAVDRRQNHLWNLLTQNGAKLCAVGGEEGESWKRCSLG